MICDWRVLVSELACGADKAFGYELPKNKACKYVLDAVLKKMDVSSGNLYSRRAHWVPSDIDKVAMHFLINLKTSSRLIILKIILADASKKVQIPNFQNCIFSFWIGRSAWAA